MIVIADTTSLISLMKINQLKLLCQLFGEVQIPESVFAELVSNKRFQKENKMIRESTYIKSVKVLDKKAVELLKRSTGLDAGESEAIILSDAMQADLKGEKDQAPVLLFDG